MTQNATDRDSITDGMTVTTGMLRVGDRVRADEGTTVYRVTGLPRGDWPVRLRSVSSGRARSMDVERLRFVTTQPKARAFVEAHVILGHGQADDDALADMTLSLPESVEVCFSGVRKYGHYVVVWFDLEVDSEETLATIQKTLTGCGSNVIVG